MTDEIAAALSCCTLCPRGCKVDRMAGQLGACQADATIRVARAALHHWEEPCISGTRGSGTVFFSHCSLGCVFCQNATLSEGGAGQEISVERLAEIFLELEAQGAHNINLVTPTHYALQIIEAARLARGRGLLIPFVYNCGGYECPQTIRRLSEVVSIWLPDYKYAQNHLAARYSNAEDYPERALAAIETMLACAGPAQWSQDGLLCAGVLVRHLLLPGLLADSLLVVSRLAERFSDQILLSLMSQFTPMPACSARFPELARPVNPRHYEALVSFAEAQNAFDCYAQEPSSSDTAFIPQFLGQGVLASGQKP